MTERQGLERLAARVLDCEDIAWEKTPGDRAEHGDPAAARVLRNLRLVDSIARTLRGQNPDAAALRQGLDQTVDHLLGPGGSAAPPASWGGLEIRGRLGAGSFADVYRAWDPALQRECALKLYRSAEPARQQALIEEGRRLARIDHPGVVRVHGAQEHDGRVGLWMELVDGPTLEELLQRDGPLGEREAALAGQDIATALAAVHAAGIVHGDVKAQNVIRRPDGSFALTDFGSGADLGPEAAPRGQGTPLYLAPEILRGEAGGTAADIYALGVLLFHLVTGSWPVAAEDLDGLRAAHANGSRRTLLAFAPGLSPEFAGAVERALAPEPGHRHPGAAEFAAALHQAVAGATAATPAPPRRRWLAAALAGVAVTALVLWALVPAPRPGVTAWRLDLQLYRLSPDGAPVALEAGAAVRQGDRLYLEIAADRPLYLYAVNEDDRGNAHGLFPLPGTEPGNPLAAGTLHRLPGGPGTDHAWQVDSPASFERIHLLASPEPLAEAARRFAELPPVTPALPGGLQPRGIGTLVPARTRAQMPARPFVQAAEGASGAAPGVEGVQYRVIELRRSDP